MRKSFEPDDKVEIVNFYGRKIETKETHADVTFQGLTAEVLRDIARNESCTRSWRKAAIKFLLKQKHVYAAYPEFKEFVNEIKAEVEAEKEVIDVVESAIEESLG